MVSVSHDVGASSQRLLVYTGTLKTKRIGSRNNPNKFAKTAGDSSKDEDRDCKYRGIVDTLLYFAMQTMSEQEVDKSMTASHVQAPTKEDWMNMKYNAIFK